MTVALLNKQAALMLEDGTIIESLTGSYIGDLIISRTDLITGQEYYLNIDGSFANTFGLSISSTLVEADTLWAIGSGAWDDPSNWSLTEGGAPAGAIPTEATVVYIKSQQITFNTTDPITFKRIILSGVEGTSTQLFVESGRLNVKEKVSVKGEGAHLKVTGTGRINVTGEQ